MFHIQSSLIIPKLGDEKYSLSSVQLDLKFAQSTSSLLSLMTKYLGLRFIKQVRTKLFNINII